MAGSIDHLRAKVKEYLAEIEGHGAIESDGFLTGLDVTFDAAKDLLEDFVKYTEGK